METFRYDPVWRRIRRDEYAKKLEGRFHKRYRRLEKLVNWGALSWLHPHATATKQAHHLGVEHNAMRFLAHEQRHHHRPSLRAAAHVLHWGHTPLSYQGSEALLRAAHVNASIQHLLDRVLDAVVAFGDLACADEDHDGRCVAAMLAGERPFELYRWLSAWIVTETWPQLWNAIKAAEAASGDIDFTEHDCKQALTRTLVCRDDLGYQILTDCNMADYVPRDLFQSGTAWLTVDPEVLWDDEPIRNADEWALVDAASSYLEQRFYQTPAAHLLHSLTSSVIANSLVGKNAFGLGELRTLLDADAGDAHLSRQFLGRYHHDRYEELRESASSAQLADWRLIGVFDSVSLPAGTRFAAEDFLTQCSGRRSLSYPHHDRYSVIVDLPDSDAVQRHMAGRDRQYGTVYVHYKDCRERQRGRPLLNAVARVSDWIEPDKRHEPGNAVLSWLLQADIRQQSQDLVNVWGEILIDHHDFFSTRLQELRERSSFIELNSHAAMSLQTRFFGDAELVQRFAVSPEYIVRMPWRGFTLSAGRSLLAHAREHAILRAQDKRDSQRGEALELAVLADQLLHGDECVHRFLMFNATEFADRKPKCEWDILRVDLHADGTWTIVATECAVNFGSQEKAEAERRHVRLRDAVRTSYSDLALYDTLLATIEDDGLHYEDGGSSYRPRE